MRRTATALLAPALLAAVLLTGCGEAATTHHKPGTGHEVATGSAGRLLDAKDTDGHRLREVAAAGAPEVGLTVRPDSEDGWNVQLSLTRFRFTPDSTGGAALPGSGHAHLYVDGRELGRLYGPWFHLPGNATPRKGTGTLTVRLHADDHTVWAVRGKPVQGTAPLTTAGPGTPAPGTPAPPAASPKADRAVDIAIADGKVDPAPGRVELKKGQRLELSVVSDKADTLHIHGYDRKMELPAGKRVTYSFVADRTGLFEVETHGSDLLLTQLAVR
ncbi:hypothetical protein [Streptomyces sp. NPDC051561]|uniref:hypothetical protein n=1 Tax=Streptomyces sp. NPDC051561 TaxID=3365658 RepID=UPI0037920B53